MIAPGKSCELEKDKVSRYIAENHPVVIGVNAINPSYTYDYLFMINTIRYNYAKEIYPRQFFATKKILLSNIKTEPDESEMIVNFNRVVKRGWEHFDNAVINVLRLLDKLHVTKISIVGFDGFKQKYNESYADIALPTLNPNNQWDKLNDEIKDMFRDFQESAGTALKIKMLTDSIFAE